MTCELKSPTYVDEIAAEIGSLAGLPKNDLLPKIVKRGQANQPSGSQFDRSEKDALDLIGCSRRTLSKRRCYLLFWLIGGFAG